MHSRQRSAFIFNSRDLSPYLLVQNVTREIIPKRKIQLGQCGLKGYAKPYGFDPMKIKVQCVLMEETARGVTDARRSLAGALYTDTPKKLFLLDDTATYVRALYIGGCAPSGIVKYPSVILEFLAPDPIAYGMHCKKRITAQEHVFFTGGTYQTRPTIKCTPHQTGYVRFRNKATDEHIGIHANFDGISELVIDCALERVTINGHDAQVDLDSDFFALNTGDILQKDGDVDSYRLEWDERYI